MWLKLLIEMATPKLDTTHVHNFNIDFLVNKHCKRLLDCEQVVHLHQYYAFLQKKIVICFTLSSLFICKMLYPPRNLLSFGEDEMFQDPTIFFLLPSYVKAQALVLESLASHPLHIVYQGYHLRVKAFIDDEALEDVYKLFLSLGVDH
jgi:hypothetical protein